MEIIRSIGILLAITSCSLMAADSDFYIDYNTCKNTVGYLVLSEESIKTIDGDPTVMGCMRQSENINCYFEHKGESAVEKGKSVSYKIIIDSPPLLHFSTTNGSEYVAINTSEHAAVLVSRALDKTYSGAKVCHGLYLTKFEMEGMQN